MGDRARISQKVYWDSIPIYTKEDGEDQTKI